jgi:hypothetical protein
MPHARVGHPGLPEAEPFETLHAAEMHQRVVIGPRLGQVNPLQVRAVLDVSQTLAGDRGAAQEKQPKFGMLASGARPRSVTLGQWDTRRLVISWKFASTFNPSSVNAVEPSTDNSVSLLRPASLARPTSLMAGLPSRSARRLAKPVKCSNPASVTR